MADPGLPVLEIILKPLYENQRASSINVALTISDPKVGAGQILLTGFAELVGVDVNRLENDTINASDDLGELSLVAEDSPPGPPVIQRNWTTKRATAGAVRAWYTALPREVNDQTRDLPSFDLRQDQDGLLGSGYGFLNLPNGSEHLIKLRWDLDQAPSGTRAVWTYGSGANETIRRDTPSGVQQTFFAVGPLQCEESTLDPSTGLTFGMYWFGTPPFNATEVATTIKLLFGYMSKFFDDDENSYRVFIRHNPYFGYGAGTALRRSFMFGWSDADSIDPPSEESQILFLGHEMVHNFAKLDDTTPQYENWYLEGLAEYYSLVLLHRGGFILRGAFLRHINRKLLSYYTNSLVNVPNQEVSKVTWQTADAQNLPYGRGFAFAIQTNYLISKATEGKNCLDDLVLELIHRRRKGQPVGINAYISLLGDYLGTETARKLYDDMSAGQLVIPSQDSLAIHSFRLERADARKWDLGFDEGSFRGAERMVRGLKTGSEAENAGLRNGDRLLNTVRLTEIQQQPDAVMRLVVQRDTKQEFEINFLPREAESVESYRYVDLKAENC